MAVTREREVGALGAARDPDVGGCVRAVDTGARHGARIAGARVADAAPRETIAVPNVDRTRRVLARREHELLLVYSAAWLFAHLDGPRAWLYA